jgi:hypothetical protein
MAGIRVAGGKLTATSATPLASVGELAVVDTSASVRTWTAARLPLNSRTCNGQTQCITLKMRRVHADAEASARRVALCVRSAGARALSAESFQRWTVH